MKVNPSPHEQKLWNNWFDTYDMEAANELIENYMYLVSFHVERIASHLPNSVMKEDVKSFGLMGLYDALKKFDRSRELKFDTYASFRIKGAIIDGLRKEDWLPRSLREKTKKIEQISNQLEQQYQRVPSTAEIAEHAGMTVKEVEAAMCDSLFANVLSIEEKPSDPKLKLKEGIGYSIPDTKSITPETQVIESELKEELKEGIKHLNENEQLVISLFYHEELTLTEIGEVLGLTTSRISQIHKKSIAKLHSILKKVQAIS
ncbi:MULTISPECIES: FliA/WhiG family RNA polymerase sigma factor [unclassified Virgibacillus]|uniref:FliA/WhiG family RNA polymerase sigma factor n=1 Tax=unclassified Virgibacillus TaxID=2620237 RepID=UPI00090BD32D|nr:MULTISPECIES: FliA/WhiG family RNA polymerase sigma factor [unclassified Virgibacillus]API93910.1 RNA polymerase subunit sigma [Virgibacillus sp. 6R]MBS7427546.1 FliA/WhiG family RNA polymerase sigma factor [Virgibacillus sp. 19R1-5]